MSRLREFDCTAFGVSFQLAADSDCVLAKMLQCAPLGTEVRAAEPAEADAQRFALLESRGAAGYRLAIGDEVVAENAALPPLLDQLARDLMVHVANYAPDRVFLHAGVVAWRGRALVLPGTSFAGKTTLVAELVRAGATYYSDEYAVLDALGRVHPYARELQMRRPGSPEQTAVAVAQLNGTPASALRVSHRSVHGIQGVRSLASRARLRRHGGAGDAAAHHPGAAHPRARNGHAGKNDGDCDRRALRARRGAPGGACFAAAIANDGTST